MSDEERALLEAFKSERRSPGRTEDSQVRAITMNKIIQQLNGERAHASCPEFNPATRRGPGQGREVIASACRLTKAWSSPKNRGLNSSFPCENFARRRRERVFPNFQSSISEVSVKRRGASPRKLYYLRDLSGKAARIDEKI